MATNAVIGALRVVLGADTAALDKGLKDAQASLGAFASKLGTSMAVVGTAVAAAATAVGYAVKKSIDEADKMSKMSQSFGVPIDELSRLKYAADLSDVSLEALGKNVGKLSKNMAEAASGAISPAKQAFDALGISVTNADGTLKGSSEVISEIAGKFETYKDGAAKTALAMALFGKSGAEMIPLLNSGAAGLKEMSDEAEKFGIVLDAKTGKSAEAFNDNMTRLGKVWEGIVLQITSSLVPGLESLTSSLVDMAKDADLVKTVADGIANGFKLIAGSAIVTVAAISRLMAEMNAAWVILKNPNWLKLGDTISSAWSALNAEGAKTKEIMDRLNASLTKLWDNQGQKDQGTWEGQASGVQKMQSEVLKLGAAWTAVDAPIIKATESGENAVEKYLAAQAKRVAGMNAEAQTVGLSAAAHERLKIQLEAEALAKQKNIPLTDALSLRIAAAGEAAAVAAMKVQAAQIAQQVMSPAEKYAQDLKSLEEVYMATSMTMETFTARQQQLAEGIGATWAQAGAGAASGFSQLATVFAKESKGMATAAKAFGIIEATINTYVAFTKALGSGIPPFNYIAAAGTLAAGMAKVAAIKSQSFMTGGSMTVRGSGGPDSVPVMVSPGETIDVYRADEPGPDPRRGSSGGEPRVYNIATPLVLSRDWVRDVFKALNDGLGDGHRLNVVPV